MPVVTLVGYRCSGKSAVAAAIADQLGCGWVDADDILEKQVGISIADLVTSRGEPAFRDVESIILAKLLENESGVVATGGGVILRESNRKLLKISVQPVVWLSAPAHVLRERLAADPTTTSRRPALAGGNVLDEVARAVAERAPFYREVADGIIDTAVDSPRRLADRIVAWLAGPRPEIIP